MKIWPSRRRNRWQHAGAALVLLGAGLAVPAWADEPAPAPSTPAPPTIQEVRVQGLSVVAEETVLAKVRTKAGAAFVQAVVNEDVRQLYQTGFFSDVSVDVQPAAEGVIVTFQVQEKPLIKAIEIQGNRILHRDKLLKMLDLKVGEFLDPKRFKDGVDQILAEYRRKGYTSAKVAHDTQVDQATGEATLYLLLDEGPKVRVASILIEGNERFSDRRIRKVMKTKRAAFWRAGVYREEVLDEDLDRIRAFYRREGFQDALVERAVATDERGRSVYLTLTVTEGPRYTVGTVELAGQQLFTEEELHSRLQMLPGSVFSQEALQEDVGSLQGAYFDRGYIFARVDPTSMLDPSTKAMQVRYRITEGELAYIDKIDIRGNSHTKDVVIRRELRVKPGDPFDGELLRRSRERLYNLGYFEEISFDHEPGTEPHHRDLVVQVKETKTGEFSFGGGFSSVDRAIGFVQVEQRNFDWKNFPTFTGAGQDLRFRTQLGTVRREFDLSFTEPWFLGHPVSLGLDAFHITRLERRSLGFAYDEQRTGGGVRLGKEFTEHFAGSVGYRLENVDISDVSSDASADLRNEEGDNLISTLSNDWTYDTRDNRFDPTHGQVFRWGVDFAGSFIGGDKDFVRGTVSDTVIWPCWKQKGWLLEVRGRAGLIDAYGDSEEVPIFERFFAGGSTTIRGYEERRVGPRDANSNDPIGGEAMAIGNIDLVIPLVENIKGTVFFDAGNVWRRVNQFGEDFKLGTGIGARIKTPIGPVRLDLGFPLNPDDNEEQRLRFHFNISRAF
ncbi:MAG: outer membrane protein assembly factor BamA [Candidatus Omnitrophica bacterium]|nr:outer membrane protein assembly factor BamA [Candidatus Omnitrophota bacterium]